MNGLNRWVPRLIYGAVLLHTVFAFTTMSGAWSDIARDGVVGSVDGHPEREYAVWFLLAGLGWSGIGMFAEHGLRATGRLPVQVPALLLAIGAAVIAFYPIGPGWLVLAIGLVAVAARRRDARTPREEVRAPADGVSP